MRSADSHLEGRQLFYGKRVGGETMIVGFLLGGRLAPTWLYSFGLKAANCICNLKPLQSEDLLAFLNLLWVS